MKNTETKDIRMKKAVVVASLSYVVFISVVFAIILFQTINSSETSIAKKIAVWEQEIAQNVFQNQNQDYLEKILNDLKEHYYVDFYSVQHNNTDYLASSEKAPSSCFRPLKTDLSLSGLPLGHVDTCLSKSLIVQASIFSPAFSSLAILGLLVFFMIYMVQKQNALKIQKTEHELIASKQVQLLMRQFSHDMKTPLSTLSMFVGVLDNIPQDKKDVINKCTDRIYTTVNKLISQKNIVNLSLPAKRDLSKVLKRAIQERKDLLTNINLSTSIPEGSIDCHIDREQMLRVLLNIIDNSVESIGSVEGSIECSIEDAEIFWRLKITDSGKGVPAEIINEVFNSGFTSGKERGTGLGLAHAKIYITQWGGSIDIYNNRNKPGATVEMALPKYYDPK